MYYEISYHSYRPEIKAEPIGIFLIFGKERGVPHISCEVPPLCYRLLLYFALMLILNKPVDNCFIQKPYQSRISISLPQQLGTTSPALMCTVLLQVTQ